MWEKEITFDRFVRGMLVVAGFAVGIWLLRYLSGVLLPLCIAWVLTYMLYPLVRFLQYRCHLRSRVVSIVVAMLLVLSVLTGMLVLVIPPTVSEGTRLAAMVTELAKEYLGDTSIVTSITNYMQQHFQVSAAPDVTGADRLQETVPILFSYAWSLVVSAFGLLMGIFGAMIIFLYTFFLLMDYEKVVENWSNMIPKRFRPMMKQLVGDVERCMNAYFRGQCLIAMLVGILFAIGFKIVGLPMAVGLGLFIGVLNLVPYLQMLGIAPALLCVGLHSMDTGESFWIILLWTFIVFLIVQGIQDLVLTPRIMSHQMGLSPAVILLSLSVWGVLLGFIGLIIALPLTTLCLSYYRRFVLKEADENWLIESPRRKGKRKGAKKDEK